LVCSSNAMQKLIGNSNYKYRISEFDEDLQERFTVLRPFVKGGSQYYTLYQILNSGMNIKNMTQSLFDEMHKTFFAEAQFALLHGACRAQKICRPEKVSNTCNSILKQRNEQEYYLSFERQNEMMFGNMPPYVGQNAHRMSPKCIKQYQSRLQSLHTCIRETQCSYLPKCVGKNCPPGSTTLQ